MKANSNVRPERLIMSGSNGFQVTWNVVRNDRVDADENPIESYDYEYANCAGDAYDQIIEGIIRSRYSQPAVEAILANMAANRNVLEALRFQAFRRLAKQVALNEAITEQKAIQVVMPLQYVLVGGRYELLADRILKIGSPYEISEAEGVEMVTVWLTTIKPEHAAIISADASVKFSEIDLLNEAV